MKFLVVLVTLVTLSGTISFAQTFDTEERLANYLVENSPFTGYERRDGTSHRIRVVFFFENGELFARASVEDESFRVKTDPTTAAVSLIQERKQLTLALAEDGSLEDHPSLRPLHNISITLQPAAKGFE